MAQIVAKKVSGQTLTFVCPVCKVRVSRLARRNDPQTQTCQCTQKMVLRCVSVKLQSVA